MLKIQIPQDKCLYINDGITIKQKDSVLLSSKITHVVLAGNSHYIFVLEDNSLVIIFMGRLSNTQNAILCNELNQKIVHLNIPIYEKEMNTLLCMYNVKLYKVNSDSLKVVFQTRDHIFDTENSISYYPYQNMSSS